MCYTKPGGIRHCTRQRWRRQVHLLPPACGALTRQDPQADLAAAAGVAEAPEYPLWLGDSTKQKNREQEYKQASGVR